MALTVLVGCSCCGFCSCWVAAGLLLGCCWVLCWLLGSGSWVLVPGLLVALVAGLLLALLGSGDKERDREREAAVLSML